MTTLGIGTRVHIGWCPAWQVRGPHDPRLRAGTVKEGPFPPGFYEGRDGRIVLLQHRMWSINLDGGGSSVLAEELLTPIDDGDPVAVREDERREVEA